MVFFYNLNKVVPSLRLLGMITKWLIDRPFLFNTLARIEPCVFTDSISIGLLIPL